MRYVGFFIFTLIIVFGLDSQIQKSINDCKKIEPLNKIIFNDVQQSLKHSQDRLPASMSQAVRSLASPSELLYNGEILISADLLENYQRAKKDNIKNKLNLSEFVPLDIKPSEDSRYVMSKIADKSLSTLMRQPQFQDSPLGRATHNVEKSLKQEVEFTSNEKNAISHKLNFQVLAFQSLAKVEYTGFTNASILYQPKINQYAFEVSEKLPTKRSEQVVLSHEVGNYDRLSRVSVRWSW